MGGPPGHGSTTSPSLSESSSRAQAGARSVRPLSPGRRVLLPGARAGTPRVLGRALAWKGAPGWEWGGSCAEPAKGRTGAGTRRAREGTPSPPARLCQTKAGGRGAAELRAAPTLAEPGCGSEGRAGVLLTELSSRYTSGYWKDSMAGQAGQEGRRAGRCLRGQSERKRERGERARQSRASTTRLGCAQEAGRTADGGGLRAGGRPMGSTRGAAVLPGSRKQLSARPGAPPRRAGPEAARGSGAPSAAEQPGWTAPSAVAPKCSNLLAPGSPMIGKPPATQPLHPALAPGSCTQVLDSDPAPSSCTEILYPGFALGSCTQIKHPDPAPNSYTQFALGRTQVLASARERWTTHRSGVVGSPGLPQTTKPRCLLLPASSPQPLCWPPGE